MKVPLICDAQMTAKRLIGQTEDRKYFRRGEQEGRLDKRYTAGQERELLHRPVSRLLWLLLARARLRLLWLALRDCEKDEVESMVFLRPSTLVG